MYYSKYNVDIDDNEKKVIYNLVTGSIVVFDQEKFKALKKLQLDEYFSSEEIEQLKEMWIIHDVADETNYIKEKHEEATNKPCDDFFKLTILTTSNCNARCYYCYENGIKKEDMSLDTAKKIVELIKEHHKNKRIFINWFGGEPLYNAEIISYISNELKNANIGYEANMTTNGYLIDKYIDKMVEEWRITRVQITIDGINDIYNKIKNYIYKDSNAFERIMNNIEQLLSKNIYVNARLNFNPVNIEPTLNTIDYLYNRFKDNELLCVYVAWLNGEKIPTPMDYTKDNNPQLTLIKKLLDYNYIVDIEDLGIAPYLYGCAALQDDFAVIGTEGNLYKCEHSVMDEESDSFGNIFTMKIDQNNIKKWEFNDYPYEECYECQLLPSCQGGCKYAALNSEKKYVCSPLKNCLKEALYLFYNKKFKEKGE